MRNKQFHSFLFFSRTRFRVFFDFSHIICDFYDTCATYKTKIPLPTRRLKSEYSASLHPIIDIFWQFFSTQNSYKNRASLQRAQFQSAISKGAILVNPKIWARSCTYKTFHQLGKSKQKGDSLILEIFTLIREALHPYSVLLINSLFNFFFYEFFNFYFNISKSFRFVSVKFLVSSSLSFIKSFSIFSFVQSLDWGEPFIFLAFC